LVALIILWKPFSLLKSFFVLIKSIAIAFSYW
jgi:hypothetical protein